MNRTDRVWAHADAAFAEADKAFAEAQRVMNDLPPNAAWFAKDGVVHQLHFNTGGGWERLRLSKKFFKMAVGVLFTGKAKLSFKDRQ